MSTATEVPYGSCHCGCGKKTRICTKTDSAIGHVKGEPLRYLFGHQQRKSPIAYLEEDRGYITPCWIWQRYVSPNGYGSVRRNGLNRGAHVVYYEDAHGPVPAGLQLDHRCEIRACVNPDHLEPVTQRENLRRGRGTKLTVEQVREIRNFDERSSTLAQRYGVSQEAVNHVRSRRLWRDV